MASERRFGHGDESTGLTAVIGAKGLFLSRCGSIGRFSIEFQNTF